jgi:hypothetical protein
MNMKKYLTFLLLVVFLLSCDHAKIKTGKIPVIDIGSAMNVTADFTLSEVASSITYIALETVDSSLVGNYPDVNVWKDKILINSLTIDNPKIESLLKLDDQNNPVVVLLE